MEDLIQEFLNGHTFCYKFNLRPPQTALVAMTWWDMLDDSYDGLVLLPSEDMCIGDDYILPKQYVEDVRSRMSVNILGRPQYRFGAPCNASWTTTINGTRVNGLSIQTRMILKTFGLVMECSDLRKMAEAWPEWII